MYQRRLPHFPTLGSFLSYLEGRHALSTVAAPVSTRLELTELHRRVISANGPALRLTRPLGSNARLSTLPVVANLFGTKERVAWGLGTEPDGLEDLGALLSWMRSPQPPRNFSQARLLLPAVLNALQARPKIVGAPKEWRAVDPDFSLLPIQTCWPGDAGPLITWPIVVSRPPGEDDTSAYNLGVYRMQVIGRDRAIVRWLPMRGGAAHHRMWKAAGREMPLAIVIGADPATLLASVMPAPEGVSELALSGIIGNRRVALAPCASIELNVPTSAEIVLEGLVSPTETALEGPFGDHTGYYNAPEQYPVFKLLRVRMRDSANYLTTFTGRAPDEPSVMGAALLDVFKPLVRQQIPEIVDLWLPPEACSYRMAVISISKKYAGQAWRVMMGFWSLLPQFSMTKMIVVVDDDIDIRSWQDVMWALATRMDPSRDVLLADRTPIDQLDFASPLEGLGGKIGFDATGKIGAETSREWGVKLDMDAAIARQVEQRWAEFFPAGSVEAVCASA